MAQQLHKKAFDECSPEEKQELTEEATKQVTADLNAKVEEEVPLNTLITSSRAADEETPDHNDEDPLTYDNVGKAIGAFERNLTTPSRFDDYREANSIPFFVSITDSGGDSSTDDNDDSDAGVFDGDTPANLA